MATQRHSQRSTVEEYFALDDSSDAKYEYVDGHVYMMSGGTKSHSRVAFNIGAALDKRLRSGDCRFYNSDVRVQISPTRYFYPDVSVTCDPTERDVLNIITSPIVIFEVLSPSTTKIDRTVKLRYYRACPTLQEYVLIHPDRMYVEIQRRREAFWQLLWFEAGDVVSLVSLGIDIPIEEFYDLIELPPDEDESTSPSLP
jgi:Uma2 family endonuclease